MCRHLAYLGAAVSLRDLVIEPPFGLYRQSWAPRRQRYGTVNADGFGVGWYAAGDPAPARYRREGPIWADRSFADLARVTRSTAVLAAVRSATEGTAADAEAAAPYGSGRWLFSLNGSVSGWPDSVAELAGQRLSPAELLRLEARCDAALVWALVRRRLEDGADPADALADVVADISAVTSARLNLLLTDGEVIAATTWGDVLGYRFGPTGVLVASEAPDDATDWTDLPDRTLLRATRDGLELRSLVGADDHPAAGPTATPAAYVSLASASASAAHAAATPSQRSAAPAAPQPAAPSAPSQPAAPSPPAPPATSSLLTPPSSPTSRSGFRFRGTSPADVAPPPRPTQPDHAHIPAADGPPGVPPAGPRPPGATSDASSSADSSAN